MNGTISLRVYPKYDQARVDFVKIAQASNDVEGVLHSRLELVYANGNKTRFVGSSGIDTLRGYAFDDVWFASNCTPGLQRRVAELNIVRRTEA